MGLCRPYGALLSFALTQAYGFSRCAGSPQPGLTHVAPPALEMTRGTACSLPIRAAEQVPRLAYQSWIECMLGSGWVREGVEVLVRTP